MSGRSIGVLYESEEWSDYYLAACIAEKVPSVRLINMEGPSYESQALSCDVLVSRVFASAQFRGHSKSLERMPMLLERASELGIRVINPASAHGFEISKSASANALLAAGLFAPTVFATGTPTEISAWVSQSDSSLYPLVIKPECGGRTTYTLIASSKEEALSFLNDIPEGVVMVAQSFAQATSDYLYRVEVVAQKCFLVVRRSIQDNGLSAYRFGSTYEVVKDWPGELVAAVERASRELGIELGSFDVVPTSLGFCIIDVNSVSNASPDCTELFGVDIIRAHADYAVEIFRNIEDAHGKGFE